MRKVFSCIVLFFAGFLAFSETGYKGVQWQTSINKLASELKRDNTEDEVNKELEKKGHIGGIEVQDYIINKIILGKDTDVSYLFVSNLLYGVCYETARDNVKALQSKYNGEPLIYYCKEIPDMKSIYDVELKTIEAQTHIEKKIVYLTSLSFELGGSSNNSMLEMLNLTQEKIKNPAGTLYIYDYNSDTRVYIYDNIIKDKAVVVYVPHEQDY